MPEISSLFSRYADLAKKYVAPSGIPALSAGLCVFLTAVYLCEFFFRSLEDSWCLMPGALFDFKQFYRLNTYPLIHAGFFHIFFNIVSIWAPLAQFETANGTVHTGVVLSVLAVVTAVPYCLLGHFLFPETAVLGASAWVFSFIAYFAYVSSLRNRTVNLFGRWEVPTLTVPFVFLGIAFLLVPNSSFLGHLLGIFAGFALAKGWLRILVPPSSILNMIESRLERLISLIPPQFNYVRESAVEGNNRYQHDAGTYLPLYDNERDAAAASENPSAGDSAAFKGPGHVLGSS